MICLKCQGTIEDHQFHRGSGGHQGHLQYLGMWTIRPRPHAKAHAPPSWRYVADDSCCSLPDNAAYGDADCPWEAYIYRLKKWGTRKGLPKMVLKTDPGSPNHQNQHPPPFKASKSSSSPDFSTQYIVTKIYLTYKTPSRILNSSKSKFSSKKPFHSLIIQRLVGQSHLPRSMAKSASAYIVVLLVGVQKGCTWRSKPSRSAS